MSELPVEDHNGLMLRVQVPNLSSILSHPDRSFGKLDDADDEFIDGYDGWDNEVYQLSGEVYWINAVASQASYESWYVCATT